MRALEHVLHGGLVGVPLASVPPVVGRDLVAFEWHFLPLLEALQLLLRADVEPELADDDLGLHELLLEVVDLRVGALPLDVGGEALDALDKHTAVVGAVEDGDASGTGQMPPETPQIMMRPFLVRGGGVGGDVEEARIKGTDQSPDCSALARAVPAFEDAEERTAAVRQFP